MIVLKHITKAFDQTTVISDLSLTVQDKEHIAIMGESGCGKTTLLRIIANLEQVDAGDREGYSQDELTYVFQEPRLFSHLTVLDNVSLASRSDRNEARENAYRLLEKVGLRDAAALYPDELSGGMAQRVSLARAMLTNAPILLLDEPFSALDESTRAKMINIVRDYCRDKTLLLVTHNKQDAEELCERTVYLS